MNRCTKYFGDVDSYVDQSFRTPILLSLHGFLHLSPNLLVIFKQRIARVNALAN